MTEQTRTSREAGVHFDPDAGAAGSPARIEFHDFATRDPRALAVVDVDGTPRSRGDIAALGNAFAHALVAAGRVPGDAVAIVAPNCAEYLAVCLGALRAGFDVVPVNWHLSDGELEHVLGDAGASVVLAHACLGAGRLGALARRLPASTLRISIGRLPGYVPLGDFVAGCPLHVPETTARGRVLAYTSATTGRPKGVVLPRHNAREALARIVRWHVSLGLAVGAGHVHLCTSMLYHSAPLEGCTTALHMGHRVVLTDRPDPEHVLALIERHRVTTSFMVPTLFLRLLKLPAAVRERYSTASLRFVVHGGAPCPVETKRAMLEWWGPIIWESYGAAEAQGTIASPREWRRYPGTVGRPIPGSAVEIVDDLGAGLAPNRVGTVYIRPHTGDRFEYRNDPARTRACYRGDLVTVGDLGYVNEDGFLFLCGRRPDLIISSGMNIYPAEIELVLVQHPAVEDCAVVGEPHPLLGEVPVGIVQPRPGIQPGRRLSAELLQFLARRVAATKVPKRITYTHALPRDPNGKLQRRRLRERERAHRPSAANPRPPGSDGDGGD